MVYRTNLVGPVFGLRREIDRLFEDAFGRGSDSARSGWMPAVDVREDEQGLTFEFELPGFRPEDVEVTSENGVLTVRGERHQERKEDTDEGRYHLMERSSGGFSRSFQLPQGLDDEGTEASFEHGLLTIRVPKAALPQPRKIQIRSGANAGGELSAGRPVGGQVSGQGTARGVRQSGTEQRESQEAPTARAAGAARGDAQKA